MLASCVQTLSRDKVESSTSLVVLTGARQLSAVGELLSKSVKRLHPAQNAGRASIKSNYFGFRVDCPNFIQSSDRNRADATIKSGCKRLSLFALAISCPPRFSSSCLSRFALHRWKRQCSLEKRKTKLSQIKLTLAKVTNSSTSSSATNVKEDEPTNTMPRQQGD